MTEERRGHGSSPEMASPLSVDSKEGLTEVTKSCSEG